MKSHGQWFVPLGPNVFSSFPPLILTFPFRTVQSLTYFPHRLISPMNHISSTIHSTSLRFLSASQTLPSATNHDGIRMQLIFDFCLCGLCYTRFTCCTLTMAPFISCRSLFMLGPLCLLHLCVLSLYNRSESEDDLAVTGEITAKASWYAFCSNWHQGVNYDKDSLLQHSPALTV